MRINVGQAEAKPTLEGAAGRLPDLMTWALLAARTTGAALSCTLRHPGLTRPAVAPVRHHGGAGLALGGMANRTARRGLTCGRRGGAGHYQLAVQPPGSRSDLPAADLRQAVDCLHLRDQGFGVSTGHIFSPTGRKNWRLSVSCEPGKK